MASYEPENGRKCSDPEAVRMGRKCQPLMRRILGFQDDVAPDLVNDGVPPPPAEMVHEAIAAQISGEFHPTASSSSRTNRIRTDSGVSPSKK